MEDDNFYIFYSLAYIKMAKFGKKYLISHQIEGAIIERLRFQT